VETYRFACAERLPPSKSRDITVAEWDKLPGKVIKVSAERPVSALEVKATWLNIKEGETYFSVPHPTERWNVSKKVTCTWKGLVDDPRFDDQTYKPGTMMLQSLNADTKKQNCVYGMPMESIISGPLKVRFSAGGIAEEYPQVYYKGDIRIKLVPAEEQ